MPEMSVLSRTAENILLPGKQYHEVVYSCSPGFRLSTETGLGHMFCQQGGWMGVHPYCEEDPDAAAEASKAVVVETDSCGDYHEWVELWFLLWGGNRKKVLVSRFSCEHLCTMVDGAPQCRCEDGYR